MRLLLCLLLVGCKTTEYPKRDFSPLTVSDIRSDVTKAQKHLDKVKEPASSNINRKTPLIWFAVIVVGIVATTILASRTKDESTGTD